MADIICSFGATDVFHLVAWSKPRENLRVRSAPRAAGSGRRIRLCDGLDDFMGGLHHSDSLSGSLSMFLNPEPGA